MRALSKCLKPRSTYYTILFKSTESFYISKDQKMQME